MPTWAIILIVCAVISVYIAGLIFLICNIINNIASKYRRNRFLNDFNRVLIVIQKKNLPINEALIQIKTDFQQLSGIYEENELSSKMRLTIKELILLHDTQPNNKIIKSDEVDLQAIRDYEWDIYNYLNETEPYAELQIKEANLLYCIKSLLPENNKEIGMNALEQLADEIQSKDKIILKKEKQNKIACVISIIGIVLTLVFGVFSILSLFL